MMLTDLADVLRAAGLNVAEAPGWKTRGKAWAAKPKGFLAHHTAGGTNVPATVSLVNNGRSDLPGPLSQFVLTKDGTVHVCAAGRANHAGAGEWRGITSGNASMLGCEAMNRGDNVDPWTPEQMRAYALLAATCAKHYGFGVEMVAGHKEYAPRRKIDPTFDMAAFRKTVSALMGAPHSPAGTHRVTASALNVRGGPAASYGVLRKLAKGDMVSPVASKDGWANIGNGWVSEAYLEMAA